MKIAVCGDSILSADTDLPGTHFTELLHSTEYTNVARIGCSNSCIRLQLDRAIELNPDLIILGATDHNRYEVPVGKYISQNSIDNIEYGHTLRCTSSQYVNSNPQNPVTMFSDHYTTLTRSSYLPSNKLQAFKSFVADLMDEDWEMQRNRFIIESICSTLIFSNINFIYIPCLSNYIPNWLDRERVFDLNIEEYMRMDPAPEWNTYHTGIHAQVLIAERIKEQFNV